MFPNLVVLQVERLVQFFLIPNRFFTHLVIILAVTEGRSTLQSNHTANLINYTYQIGVF